MFSIHYASFIGGYVRTYTSRACPIIADLDELTEVGQNGSPSCSDPSPGLLPALYCLLLAARGQQ